MIVKVIEDNGCFTAVLTDTQEPVEVEILRVDKNLPDYEDLQQYADDLLHDSMYTNCPFTVANFTEKPYERVDAPAPEPGMICRLKASDHVKQSLWGKEVTVLEITPDGAVVCLVAGKDSPYFAFPSVLEDLKYPSSESGKEGGF